MSIIENTLSRKSYAKMSFTEFIQDECGGAHNLPDILYNLEKDQISESLINYSSHKKRAVSFTKYEIKCLTELINRGF